MVKQRRRFESLDLIPGEAAFRAYGSTLPELFSNAALALFSIMVDIASVQPREKRSIRLSDSSLERLFLDYLSELVYLKDAAAMLFSEYLVTITRRGGYHLEAEVRGERIDPLRHKLGVDVKGVTMHMYKFKHLKRGYSAQVILDI